jgi:hypothetical protein
MKKIGQLRKQAKTKYSKDLGVSSITKVNISNSEYGAPFFDVGLRLGSSYKADKIYWLRFRVSEHEYERGMKVKIILKNENDIFNKEAQMIEVI